jgi:class I fructose-bisphosphate aldolase
MTATLSAPQSIAAWLGDEAEDLLTHQAKVSKDLLHLPSPDFIDRTFAYSDRSPQVLRSLQHGISVNLARRSRD